VQHVESEHRKIGMKARLAGISGASRIHPEIGDLAASADGLRQIAITDLNKAFGGPKSDAYGILSRTMDPPRSLQGMIDERSTIEKRDDWEYVTMHLTGHDVRVLSSYLTLALQSQTTAQQNGAGVLSIALLHLKYQSEHFTVITQMLDQSELYPAVKTMVDPALPVEETGDPLKDTIAFFRYQVSLGIPVNLHATGLTLEQVLRMSDETNTPSTPNPQAIYLCADYKGTPRIIEIRNGKVIAHAKGYAKTAKETDIELRGRLHEFLDSQFNLITPYDPEGPYTAWVEPSTSSTRGIQQPPGIAILNALYRPDHEGIAVLFPAVTDPRTDLGLKPEITLALEDVRALVIVGFGIPPAQIGFLTTQTMFSKNYDSLNFAAVKAHDLEAKHQKRFEEIMSTQGKGRYESGGILTQAKYAALLGLFSN